ncbi:hypothetical protein B0A48_12314 [Cryoendolithus antarcticus]|uniref:RING-type domain-containing protein n=1 Tax=Cryoendolithus antarcticus TaxID=1507870 RepID=A0A1V8SS62_9PEZI|nr:hypothetical protein B0A48_12314 [Cryoendolithus antarcticus]
MADLTSREAIEEELAFQDYLFMTLEEASDSYEERLAEIEDARRDLNERLQALEQSGSQDVGTNGYGGGPVGYGNGISSYDGVNDGPSYPALGAPSNSRVSSGSSNSGYAGGAGLKRARPESGAYPDYPSKRNTPEPSSAGTPSSHGSFDWPTLDQPASAAAGNGLEAAKRRQMAAEAAIARQLAARRADEDFARSLSGQSGGAMASSSRGPSGVQTTLRGDGSWARPPPPAAVKQESRPVFGQSNGYHIPPTPVNGQSSVHRPQSNSLYGAPDSHLPKPSQPHGQSNGHGHHVKPESGYGHSHHNGIKREPSLALPPQRLPQRTRAQVVDLTGDGSDDDDGLAEIMPQHFTPNDRGLATRNQTLPSIHRQQLPGLSPNVSNGMYTAANSMQMPGAYPGSPSMSSGCGGQPVYNRLPPLPSTPRAPVQQPNAGALHMMPGETPGQFIARLSGRAMNGAANTLGSTVNQLNGLINGPYARPIDLDDDDSDVEFAGYGARAPGYQGHDDLYNTRYNAIHDHNPEKTREEINALLDNIRPDDDMPEELLVKTPASMAVTLHKYQELGLTWMKGSEEGANKGGILGDDMGLGKTIQMISLMVTRKSEDPRCKTNLIVAPVALLRQWKQEIATRIKTGRHALTVFTHHGQGKAKSFDALRKYDVVLTTFGSLASELKKREAFALRKKNDPTARPYPREQCALIGEDYHWYRVILDEAQNIKNKSTQSAKAACSLQATYRWCMTGTPMMNNVEELYSLIRFLRIRPYNVWETFRKDFTQPLKSSDDGFRGQAMKKLQTLCVKLMIRRTKKSEFQGKPIIVLPERTTEVDNPVFNDDEKSLYTALETKTAVQFNRYLKAGTVGRSYTAILVLLLRLRQACCHPHLIKDFSVSEAAGVTIADMEALAKELSEQVISRIKDTDGNFECPICLDACTNPAIFVPCGHDTCRDCFATLADPANATAVGEADGEGGASVKCPHCRAKVDPKRITDFNSFRKIHMPESFTEAEREALAVENGPEDSEIESEDSETESEDEDQDHTLGGFIVNDEDVDSETESGGDVKPKFKKESGGELAHGPQGMFSSSKVKLKKKKKSKEKSFTWMNGTGEGTSSGKGKGKAAMKGKGKGKKNAELTLAELKKLSTRNQGARKKYLKKLRKEFISSAKIDKTMELLDTIISAPDDPTLGGEKVLIFSQWTSLLDLMEIPIDEKGWKYRRYDGSMAASARGDAVDDFKSPRENVRIMLVSLKAGNAGLNLNVASQVIILDPFWNPYIEEQAIDRAHRIGQLRDVKVHRVLVTETVEDRILALQEKKRQLIETALDEKEGKKISRLGVQELAYLFGVTRNPDEIVRYQARDNR